MKIGSTLLLTLSLFACRAPMGEQTWKPTVGVDTSIYEDLDFDINSLIFAASGDIEYKLTQLTVGATLTEPGQHRDKKIQFLGGQVGTGELKEAGISSNLVETSLGSIWYFDTERALVPYLSVFGTMSDTSKIPDLGNQGGLRFGLGVEVPIHGGLSAQLGGDYLLPIYDAKTSSGVVEADLEGIVVRFGLTYMF